MMYYTVYKVINLINGKIYIGCHKTKNLNDCYMGSGKNIKLSIEKYGIENFKKEILFIFDTPEQMYEKEAEIVNEEFIKCRKNYNLKVGGFGGFDYINSIPEFRSSNTEGFKLGRKKTDKKLEETYGENWRSILAKKGNSISIERLKTDLVFREKVKENAKKASDAAKTETAKQKRKETFIKNEHQKGEKNSQFGTMWICNLELKQNKKILKIAPLPEGWIKGRKTFK